MAMTYTEALEICKMALIAVGMKYPDPKFKDCGFYDEDSITNLVKELTEKHDIEILMEALEKQIPKKPISVNGLYYCPHHHQFLNMKVDYWTICQNQPFCEWCGQAIDWSDEK